MGVSIVRVDAFTDKPFAGNPAAVCEALSVEPLHGAGDLPVEDIPVLVDHLTWTSRTAASNLLFRSSENSFMP